MPIPSPKPREDQKDFIQRCVTDETMASEFPNKDQRIAVCYQQWKEK